MKSKTSVGSINSLLRLSPLRKTNAEVGVIECWIQQPAESDAEESRCDAAPVGGRCGRARLRGSEKRYEAAERKAIEVMRQREEARKHIIDGYTIHLLMHTDGKVVGDEGEVEHRFMRCKNEKGFMVRWLEPPALEDNRSVRENASERVPRWSNMRYEWAKCKLIDIMREMGCEIGNPIERGRSWLKLQGSILKISSLHARACR